MESMEAALAADSFTTSPTAACRKLCEGKGGLRYDEMVEKREKLNLLTTYDPHEHLRYRSSWHMKS